MKTESIIWWDYKKVKPAKRYQNEESREFLITKKGSKEHEIAESISVGKYIFRKKYPGFLGEEEEVLSFAEIPNGFIPEIESNNLINNSDKLIIKKFSDELPRNEVLLVFNLNDYNHCYTGEFYENGTLALYEPRVEDIEDDDPGNVIFKVVTDEDESYCNLEEMENWAWCYFNSLKFDFHHKNIEMRLTTETVTSAMKELNPSLYHTQKELFNSAIPELLKTFAVWLFYNKTYTAENNLNARIIAESLALLMKTGKYFSEE
jgi:hypothetical protein